MSVFHGHVTFTRTPYFYLSYLILAVGPFVTDRSNTKEIGGQMLDRVSVDPKDFQGSNGY